MPDAGVSALANFTVVHAVFYLEVKHGSELMRQLKVCLERSLFSTFVPPVKSVTCVFYIISPPWIVADADHMTIKG